jgi:CubicO group peptidase (beta-lactamase class C family)
MGKMIRLFLSALLCSFIVAEGAPAPKTLSSYPAKCERALRDFDCKGVSVAIVQDDQVTFVEGFGVRDQASKLPVDSHTLFAIGSITKGMVTAILSMLVEEGKLQWQDRVVDYLPDMQLYDGWVGKEMRVSDLLSHRSGLSDHAGDLLFLNLEHEQMIERLQQLKPVSGFRASFAYQNLMYLVAGRLIEKVTGEKWEELVQVRILNPLGMTETLTDVSAAPFEKNLALGHLHLTDGWHSVDWKDQVDFGPAGSVVSNAWEMAQWIRLVLQPGGQEGWPIWDFASLQQSQVFLPMSPWVQRLYRSASFMGCGMGWFSYDYFGHRVIEHSGNIPGLSAKIVLVPEKKVGVIVLCNQHESLLPHALVMEALDRLLGTPSVDWVRRMALLSPRRKATRQMVRRAALPGPKGEELVGSYHHSLIGDIAVTMEKGVPVLYYGRMAVGDMSFVGKDRYRVQWRQTIPRLIPGDLPIQVIRGDGGEISGIRLETLAAFKKES